MGTGGVVFMTVTPNGRTAEIASEFLSIAGGFLLSAVLYLALIQGGLSFRGLLLHTAISAATFWVAIRFVEVEAVSGWRVEPPVVVALKQFLAGAGANLIVHSLLTYGFFLRRAAFLSTAGSLFAAALLLMSRRLLSGREQAGGGVVFVGFDRLAQEILEILVQPVLGVVGGDPSLVPRDVPFWDSVAALDEIVAYNRVARLIVSTETTSGSDGLVGPFELLNYRFSGIAVEESATLYERLFHRVNCARLKPMELLLSSAFRGDSRTMAIQAIYTNVAAMCLLLALVPVLALGALAVALFLGPGPIFETFECAGFQYIPFRLLRFRTRRADGTTNRAGHAMRRLRIDHLPELINVVRGDMALVGPRPVRRPFATYLTDLMPFYSHRFSVRPGMFGWAQLQSPGDVLMDECANIEYDLYYVKEGTPWLDGEIVLKAFWNRFRPARVEFPAEASAAQT
jgi:lipopolysaccharide/colanic/teichoic acid biosynthesis glycosyltransferase